jgi:anti-anti-sigma factor
VTSPAHTEVSEHDGVVVARLVGEVDMSNARQLGRELTESVSNAALGVVLDLTETTYLDSSGVALMFELAERLRARQQQLRVAVAEGAPLRRVLGVVDLHSTAPIEPSVEDAVAAVRAAP